jgi:hypothetical protein
MALDGAGVLQVWDLLRSDQKCALKVKVDPNMSLIAISHKAATKGKEFSESSLSKRAMEGTNVVIPTISSKGATAHVHKLVGQFSEFSQAELVAFQWKLAHSQ